MLFCWSRINVRSGVKLDDDARRIWTAGLMFSAADVICKKTLDNMQVIQQDTVLKFTLSPGSYFLSLHLMHQGGQRTLKYVDDNIPGVSDGDIYLFFLSVQQNLIACFM